MSLAIPYKIGGLKQFSQNSLSKLAKKVGWAFVMASLLVFISERKAQEMNEQPRCCFQVFYARVKPPMGASDFHINFASLDILVCGSWNKNNYGFCYHSFV